MSRRILKEMSWRATGNWQRATTIGRERPGWSAHAQACASHGWADVANDQREARPIMPAWNAFCFRQDQCVKQADDQLQALSIAWCPASRARRTRAARAGEERASLIVVQHACATTRKRATPRAGLRRALCACRALQARHDPRGSRDCRLSAVCRRQRSNWRPPGSTSPGSLRQAGAGQPTAVPALSAW